MFVRDLKILLTDSYFFKEKKNYINDKKIKSGTNKKLFSTRFQRAKISFVRRTFKDKNVLMFGPQKCLVKFFSSPSSSKSISTILKTLEVCGLWATPCLKTKTNLKNKLFFNYSLRFKGPDNIKIISTHLCNYFIFFLTIFFSFFYKFLFLFLNKKYTFFLVLWQWKAKSWRFLSQLYVQSVRTQQKQLYFWTFIYPEIEMELFYLNTTVPTSRKIVMYKFYSLVSFSQRNYSLLGY